MAGGPSALAPALRADIQLVAEPGRALLALNTGRAIRRGSFRSVRELVQRIDHFVANHNTDCKPFIWTATADSILAKLQRLTMRISGTAH
jgi:hypothetical protein